MKIIIQTNKIRCDVGKCKNQARYSVAPEGVSPSQYINICEDCATEVYSALGKHLVPKSPKNMLAKAVKRGNE
ncbi:MAG: hypothetical protein K2O95_06020 [Clostridia bacterium]|nr:hypothetical protein [Clostridia bacterium]MDE6757678.1 hypothetical protein [Clostridia bacterium]MDE7079652.1 hypothetical protein [Clostridia bacterium]